MEHAQRDRERKVSRRRRYDSREPSSDSLSLELADVMDECEDEDGDSVLNDEVRVYARVMYVCESLTDRCAWYLRG